MTHREPFMQQFDARVTWQRAGQDVLGGRYSRAHTWRFDGGLQVPASSSPLSVPLPMSDPAAIDPEEALVAAASSCHMLFFLALAAQQGFVVERYDDAARGFMGPNAGGRIAMLRIELHPAIVFDGARQPTAQERAALHHLAHERCYVANSLNADIVILENP